MYEPKASCVQKLCKCMTGWPDWIIFCKLGHTHGDFLERWSSTNKCQHFGYVFLEQKLLHFHLIEQFQNMVWFRNFEVSKGDWCRCFGLSNRILMQRIFGNCFGYFSNNLANFSQSSGHPGAKVHVRCINVRRTYNYSRCFLSNIS